MKELHIADTRQVRPGDITDICSFCAEKILKEKTKAGHVCMKMLLASCSDTDKEYTWGIPAGLKKDLTAREMLGL